MNRQELFRAARREVERRRLAAETEAARRRAEFVQACPEYGRLTHRQSEAGAMAARLAADGQTGAAAEKLEQVRNLAAQKSALAKKAGVDESALAPRYHCATCRDTGRDGGETCACVMEQVRRLRRREINESGPLALCSFDSFSLERYPEKTKGTAISPRAAMGAILRDCRDWAGEFGPKSVSLFMYGDAGLGKTHLALSIASRVLDAGYDVIYVSAQQAFSAVSQQRYEGDELFGSMMEAELLILDDLGIEAMDAYLLGRLYELVNGRMNRRPTIYTTNTVSYDQLAQRYTEKIASRLMGDCHLMRFWGDDLRLQKHM